MHSRSVFAIGASIAVLAVASQGMAAPVCAPQVTAQTIADIRAKGLADGRAAALATRLADEVGGRLTWSAGYARATDWASAAFRDAGIADVRLEPIREQGVGWRQGKTWMQLTTPDSAMLNVQAATWSAPSKGAQTGEAVLVDIRTVADIEAYRGKLAGKVVLLGPARSPVLSEAPLVQRLDTPEKIEAAVAPIRTYHANRPERLRRFGRDAAFADALADFLKAEAPAVILAPSRAMPEGGDSGLLVIDDPPVGARGGAWRPGKGFPVPILIAAPESYNRPARLAAAGAPVGLSWRIDVENAGAQTANNVVATWPGADPKLAAEDVLIGAHLDSWASGVGAADNGAGVAIVLHAIRLLKEAGYQPRRTIRVVLYAGEEQGLLGAQSYAARHLGEAPRATTPEQLAVPVESWRLPVGPVKEKPGYGKLAVAMNLDHGAGRIRGVFTGGGNAPLAQVLEACTAPLKDIGVARVLDQSTWPADQWVYSSIGLPTLAFLQDPLDYDTRAHHTNLDTPEHLSAEDMAQASTVAAVLLAQMAAMDEAPPRPKP